VSVARSPGIGALHHVTDIPKPCNFGRMRSTFLLLVTLAGCRDAAPSTVDAAAAPASASAAPVMMMVRAAQCAYVPGKIATRLVNVTVASSSGTDTVGVAPGSGFCVFELRTSASAPKAPRVSGPNVVALPEVTRSIASGAPSTTVVRVYDLAFESALKARTPADCARMGELTADAKTLEANLRAAQQRFIDDGVTEDAAHGWAIAHVPVAMQARTNLGAACPALKVW
jgi:hypothetical protein